METASDPADYALRAALRLTHGHDGVTHHNWMHFAEIPERPGLIKGVRKPRELVRAGGEKRFVPGQLHAVLGFGQRRDEEPVAGLGVPEARPLAGSEPAGLGLRPEEGLGAVDLAVGGEGCRIVGGLAEFC